MDIHASTNGKKRNNDFVMRAYVPVWSSPDAHMVTLSFVAFVEHIPVGRTGGRLL